MNISRNWLKEFVDIEATDREYDEIMTIAGQKVETTTRMDAEIKNVVVGKVLSMARHENSDHMWVCMVDVGAEQPVQIVTGAQNVHEGDLVPVAQAQLVPPRRRAYHEGQAARRGVLRHALLVQGAGSDAERCAGRIRGRHLDSEQRGLHRRRGHQPRHGHGRFDRRI